MPALALAALLLAVPTVAVAGPPTADEPVDELRDFSLTFATGHLLLATVKLNGELRVAEDWGLQASLGVGKPLGLTFAEVGGQLRWYVIGDFDHGMQFGIELMLLDLSTTVPWEPEEEGGPEEMELGIRAVALGPFVGYKVAFDGGFTLEAQLGLQRYGVETYADADYSELHDKLSGFKAQLLQEASFVAPLANFNLGWSF